LRGLLAVCDRAHVTFPRALVLLSSLALLVACGSEVHDAEGLEAEPIAVTAPERVERATAPALYDDEGNLLESEDHVSGILLPVALTSVVSEDRRHVYQTDVPLTKVLRYFGPRLVTGRVDPGAGGGATYRDALPRDAAGSSVHVDVAITPIPGPRTRIEIEELLPPPPTPPSEAEAMEDLARRMQQAE
jgi:hypothetical protein